MLISGDDVLGSFTVLRYTAPPRFAGPPRHRHARTTEAFGVLDGLLSVDINSKTTVLTPGDWAAVQLDAEHSFRNETDHETTFLVVASPAGLDLFLYDLAELIAASPEWPPSDMTALQQLNARFDQLGPLS